MKSESAAQRGYADYPKPIASELHVHCSSTVTTVPCIRMPSNVFIFTGQDPSAKTMQARGRNQHALKHA